MERMALADLEGEAYEAQSDEEANKPEHMNFYMCVLPVSRS